MLKVIWVSMGDFVGRVDELKYLEAVNAKAPVACAVFGRRHIGKTALVRRFCEGRPFIYISGTPYVPSYNLNQYSKVLSEFIGHEVKIENIVDLFPTIKKACGKRNIVVVLDNYSMIVDCFPEFYSYLKSFLNRDLGSTKITLLVCDVDNSVFGRFYYTLNVKAMSYRDCMGFHPNYTPLQHIKTYSIAGGTPAYQKLFGDDPDESIRMQMFDHLSVLSLEAEGLIKNGASAYPNCSRILAAMSEGAESPRDIAALAEISQSVCSKTLEEMEHMGILIKEVTTGQSRRQVYNIKSNLLKFYYEVIYKHTPTIEFYSASSAYDDALDAMNDYFDRAFKTICMDYVTLKYTYRYAGKIRKKDDSLDSNVDFVVGISENGVGRTIIAKCKLDGEPISLEDFKRSRESGNRTQGINRMYMMFSGCGFTDELVEEAKIDPNIKLVTLEDIFGAW